MKTIKQLLRQPLKTAAGILLMTLAAAILCVSVGQAFSVRTTTEKLNDRFATVAIPLAGETVTSDTVKLSATVDEELLQWLEQTAAEHPDVLKGLSYHGILSAHIPELTPLNITGEPCIYDSLYGWDMGYYYFQPEPYGVPYSCAMLVIELEDVERTKVETVSVQVEGLGSDDFESMRDFGKWLETAEKKTTINGYTYAITGTVTEVLSLQEGYRDCVGRTARLTMTVPTLEAFEALDLTPGKRYIVYGMDYSDDHWKLVGRLNYNGQYDHLDLYDSVGERLQVMDDAEIQKYKTYYEQFGANEFKDLYARFYGITITYQQYLMANSVSMTLDLPVPLASFEAVRDEGGILRELIPRTEVTYTDEKGEKVTMSTEEYTQRYRIPTIAELEGDAEDFLKSEEGAFWKAALRRDAVNHQAFGVIGVDNLSYLSDFSLQKTRIVEGRDFTARELEEGARVCVIHEELAQANGISVGDTLTAGFYTADQGLPYQNTGLLNPAASFYFDTTPITETAAYTVVGICRGERTFPDMEENVYAFSANTLYVPKSSVQTPMEKRTGVPFVTVAIHNGKLEEFTKLATVAGYKGYFRCNDQGYASVAANFHNYEALSMQVLTAGIGVYMVIALLFTALYTASGRKNVQIMKSLGAGGFKRFGYVFGSNMMMILVSSLLGCLAGSALWDRAAGLLQKTAESAVLLEIGDGTILVIAVVQLLFALILNALASALAKGR